MSFHLSVSRSGGKTVLKMGLSAASPILICVASCRYNGCRRSSESTIWRLCCDRGPMHNFHRDQRAHKNGVHFYSPYLYSGDWILCPQRRKFPCAERWLPPGWISQSPTALAHCSKLTAS